MPTQISVLSQELFESIFKYAHGGIAIVSIEGRWVKVNPSVLNMLGYSEDEMYKLSFQEITHRDDLNSDLHQMNKLLDGAIDSYQMEKRYFHKDGHVVWALLSVSLVKNHLNQPHYFISQVTDISAHKKASWQSSLLLNIVKKQNETLTNFAHMATHDIRTPVGNISSIIEFIEDECKETANNENFTMLKESVAQLNETLEHLNEIRKSNQTEHKSLKALSLHTFVAHAIYNINGIARKQKCEIINTVSPDAKVFAIEAYLDSIILNFLSNAIKYRSPDRKPFVKLSSEESDNYIVLKICDNGLGINLNKNKDKVFQLNGTFHQHEDSRGVGLYITKNHIESIGGKVEVESTVNEGTCFSIYLLKAEQSEDLN